jgi:hypothetical protein
VQRSQSTLWGNDDSEEDLGNLYEGEKPEVNTKSPEQLKEDRKKAIANFPWTKFLQRTNGCLLLGVHETTEQNVASLVANGPDPARVGLGHGSGKGEGFYVTPIDQKKFSTVVNAIEYDECFVAIYIKTSAKRRSSSGAASVAEVEKIYKEEFEEDPNEPCYYVMAAGGEIVIPTRCFGLVRVAAKPEDCGKWR